MQPIHITHQGFCISIFLKQLELMNNVAAPIKLTVIMLVIVKKSIQ